MKKSRQSGFRNARTCLVLLVASILSAAITRTAVTSADSSWIQDGEISLTLAASADAVVPDAQGFLLGSTVATVDEVESKSLDAASLSLDVVGEVQVENAAFELAATSVVEVPVIASAPSSHYRVMTIGRPLLAQAATPAPQSVRPAVWIGAERIYIVEGGMTRQYSFGSMARFLPIRHRTQVSNIPATKSFVKLADAVKASSSNIAYGAQYVERNFQVFSVPEVPEPASVTFLAVVSGVALLKRRRRAGI